MSRSRLGIHVARRAGHQIGALLRLGEGDDVAQALGAGEQHRQAVHAQGDAAVRRRAELERVEQEAELLRASSSEMPERREDLAPAPRVVQADRAAADLEAVEHQVVAVALHPPGSVSRNCTSSSCGRVKAWCAAAQRFASSSYSKSGGFDDPEELATARPSRTRGSGPASWPGARAGSPSPCAPALAAELEEDEVARLGADRRVDRLRAARG